MHTGTFQQRLKCRGKLVGVRKRVAKETPELKGVTKLEQRALPRVRITASTVVKHGPSVE
jgi:hypothetical protein